MTSIVLEKIKFAFEKRLTKEELEKIDIEVGIDEMTDEIVLKLRGFMWAQDIGGDYVCPECGTKFKTFAVYPKYELLLGQEHKFRIFQ